jgi:hypothetical protein
MKNIPGRPEFLARAGPDRFGHLAEQQPAASAQVSAAAKLAGFWQAGRDVWAGRTCCRLRSPGGSASLPVLPDQAMGTLD